MPKNEKRIWSLLAAGAMALLFLLHRAPPAAFTGAIPAGVSNEQRATAAARMIMLGKQPRPQPQIPRERKNAHVLTVAS